MLVWYVSNGKYLVAYHQVLLIGFKKRTLVCFYSSEDFYNASDNKILSD